MNSTGLTVIGFLLFACIRGLALWILVPVGTAFWLCASPYMLWHGVGLGRFLGWLDLNFITSLRRWVVRPFVAGNPPPWVPFAEIKTVTHRIGLTQKASDFAP